MTKRMTIQGLMIDPVSRMPIVILKDDAKETVMPIWVGVFEANAIAMQLEKIDAPRPMTHDLLRSVIESLKATVDRVEITDLKENVFYGKLVLSNGDGEVEVDVRPSDAIALALRTGAPILVHDAVIVKSSSGSEEPAADEAERLRKYLEEVDPEELGHYEM